MFATLKHFVGTHKSNYIASIKSRKHIEVIDQKQQTGVAMATTETLLYESHTKGSNYF